MVDAIHLLLIKMLMQQAIQHLRGFDILTKRFFHHDTVQAARRIQTGFVQAVDHRAKFRWLDRQIKNYIGAATHLRRGQRFFQLGVVFKLMQFTLDIGKTTGEFFEQGAIEFIA